MGMYPSTLYYKVPDRGLPWQYSHPQTEQTQGPYLISDLCAEAISPGKEAALSIEHPAEAGQESGSTKVAVAEEPCPVPVSKGTRV